MADGGLADGGLAGGASEDGALTPAADLPAGADGLDDPARDFAIMGNVSTTTPTNPVSGGGVGDSHNSQHPRLGRP